LSSGISLIGLDSSRRTRPPDISAFAGTFLNERSDKGSGLLVFPEELKEVN